MKKLIFQYWLGESRPGVTASRISLEAYARRVGAQYRFATDCYVKAPRPVQYYYDNLRPVFDEGFDHWDRVLFVDSDIIVRDKVVEDIFEEGVEHVGWCEEPQQPAMRAVRKRGICTSEDHRWAKTLGIKPPVDSEGRMRVFNSGVVLYTREGVEAARRAFWKPNEYVQRVKKSRFHKLYITDQHYLHAMLHAPKQPVRPTVLPTKWNAQIHGVYRSKEIYDGREKDTNFVHIQLSGADYWPIDTHWRIANLPQKEWNLPV